MEAPAYKAGDVLCVFPSFAGDVHAFNGEILNCQLSDFVVPAGEEEGHWHAFIVLRGRRTFTSVRLFLDRPHKAIRRKKRIDVFFNDHDYQVAVWNDIPQKDIERDEHHETDLARNAQLGKKAAMACYSSRYPDPKTAITDTLANLRHLCDALDVDFDEATETAYEHYIKEKHGNPDL